VSSALSAAATDLELLDGLRLNYAFRAGIVRLLARQEYLNKINVFPVPDGDTGTNLAITMGAVLGVLQRVPDAHAGNTLTRVADAALDGARGNSGAILAQSRGPGPHRPGRPGRRRRGGSRVRTREPFRAAGGNHPVGDR
jgi:hypothetical protein